jgi:hypothetical protein
MRTPLFIKNNYVPFNTVGRTYLVLYVYSTVKKIGFSFSPMKFQQGVKVSTTLNSSSHKISVLVAQHTSRITISFFRRRGAHL